ncbi:MAG: chemotaxis protein CheB [Syntrophobacteraceae bacterium]
MSQSLKVLIVEKNDDNRNFVAKVIRGIGGGIESVDSVANGISAVARLKQHPADIVLMEVDTPLAESVKILERLHKSYPEMGIIAISEGAEELFDAVQTAQLGLLDSMSSLGMDFSEEAALSLRRRIMTLIGLYKARRNSQLTRQLHNERALLQESARNRLAHPEITGEPRPAGGKRSSNPIAFNRKIELVAIGISTGGPNALADLIPMLPSDLGVPLLIVQHMPEFMTASLAQSLNKKSALEVREAVDGEEVMPNIAYIASGGRHMTVIAQRCNGGPSGKRLIRFTGDPPVNSCRPSVDVLFYSLAKVYSGRVLALIMTGMGNDGTEGVRALKEKNCYCISQSEGSCVVYGMPRAVVEAGLCDESTPLDNMAHRILELVRGENLKGSAR